MCTLRHGDFLGNELWLLRPFFVCASVSTCCTAFCATGKLQIFHLMRAASAQKVCFFWCAKVLALACTACS